MTDNVRKWVKFVDMADYWAKQSKDPSTQVGVVLVPKGTDLPLGGYNGFPRGVDDDEDNAKGRWDRPTKYSFVEHAERNSIYNAARLGLSTKGATMYFNWEPIPCDECAKAVIQAGVTRLIGYGSRKFPGKGHQWEESLAISKIMLSEAGVEVLDLDAVIGGRFANILDTNYGDPLPLGLVRSDTLPPMPPQPAKKGCCGGCSADKGKPLPRVDGFFERTLPKRRDK